MDETCFHGEVSTWSIDRLKYDVDFLLNIPLLEDSYVWKSSGSKLIADQEIYEGGLRGFS